MASVIKLKRNSTAGEVPSSGALQAGELAINLADKKLFSSTDGSDIINVSGDQYNMVTGGNSTVGQVVLTVDNTSLSNDSISFVGDNGTVISQTNATHIEVDSTTYAVTTSGNSTVGQIVLTPTGGGDSGADTLAIKGANGIVVSGNSTQITVTAESFDYDLSAGGSATTGTIVLGDAGGDDSDSDTITLNGGDNITITNTSTSAISVSLDSAVSTGSVATTGDVTVGGDVDITGEANAASLVIPGSGTADIGGNANVGGNLGIDGSLDIDDTTDSNANNTGSITTSGGIGVAKSVTIGQNLDVEGSANVAGTLGVDGALDIDDSTNSTSNTTGSIITAGGIGAAKSVTIGENLKVHGTSYLTGTVTIEGNLDVQGSTTTVQSTVVEIDDNMLSLADNQTATDSLDTGFYGSYGNSSVTQHFGVARDASANTVVVFNGHTTEPGNDIGATPTLAQLDAVIDGGTYS